MFASILATLTTVLLVSSVLAAPSPRPGFKQTNRRAVAKRMMDKANGVVRRQAPSARIYPTCLGSPLPAGQGVQFANYAGDIGFVGNDVGVDGPSTSQTDCIGLCEGDATCQATIFTTDAGGVCVTYTGFSNLVAGTGTTSFKGDCAALAAANPGIGALDCCNYFVGLD